MRYRLVSLTLVAYLLSLFAGGLAEAETVNAGIFRIVLSACGPKGKGFVQTGFRTQWNGQHGILTALHGVSGCGKYYAIQHETEGGVFLDDLKLVAVDVDRDVAFLSSTQLASADGGPLPKAKYNIAQDRLKVIGYPDGALSQVDGQLRYHDNPLRLLGSWHQRVSNMCEKRKSPSCDINVLLVAEEPLIPGHSGAPILNQYNQVIGVADGGLQGGFALLNWIIPYADINLVPVGQRASDLSSLKQQDFTELFASVSTIDENKYPTGSGVEISGRILYGGYGNSSPIGVAANYTRAYAIIQLWDTETRKEVPIDFTYDNQSGTYAMKNVPVGKFGINVRLESGYPFNKASGGDFISYLSGLNEDIVVAPYDKRISRDLKVVHSIHLKQPVDNQKERTFTTDPRETLRQSQGNFEWEPVPGASYYEVYLYLGETGTNEFKRLVNPHKTNITVFRADLQVTSPNTYYMFRVAAYDASGSLIGHFSNYYKNGFGGWFEFGVL